VKLITVLASYFKRKLMGIQDVPAKTVAKPTAKPEAKPEVKPEVKPTAPATVNAMGDQTGVETDKGMGFLMTSRT